MRNDFACTTRVPLSVESSGAFNIPLMFYSRTLILVILVILVIDCEDKKSKVMLKLESLSPIS